MLDHLTTPRKRDGQRTTAGIAVSIALHAALITLLAYGVGAAGHDRVGTDAASGPGPVDDTRGGAGGIGGPITISRLAVSPLDLRAAELALRIAPRLPDTLELGRAVPVRLLLPAARISPDSLLRVETASGAPVTLHLSHTRLATLHGRRFVVEPLTPGLQVADEARATEWLWRVTPTEAGTQPLSLRLDAVARVDGLDRVVTLADVPGQVVVRATAIQRASRFFSHHWTWLSLLTLVALAGWMRATLDRRAPV